MHYEQQIIKMIESDDIRMKALRVVKALKLPDWLIAAGFVRNLVWGNIFNNNTKLNDIDVIYFCPLDCSAERDLMIEECLRSAEPEMPWSVKNQARMHLKNGDAPYKNTIDAMSYWPEKQTAIGVRLDDNDRIIVHHSFDLEMQFNGQITHNPVRSIEIFNDRVENKGWLQSWSQLQVKTLRRKI